LDGLKEIVQLLSVLLLNIKSMMLLHVWPRSATTDTSDADTLTNLNQVSNLPWQPLSTPRTLLTAATKSEWELNSPFKKKKKKIDGGKKQETQKYMYVNSAPTHHSLTLTSLFSFWKDNYIISAIRYILLYIVINICSFCDLRPTPAFQMCCYYYSAKKKKYEKKG